MPSNRMVSMAPLTLASRAGSRLTFRPALVQAHAAAALGRCATMPAKPANSGQVRELQMAKIVLGLGTSHTPMLLASDETLLRFRETDEKIKHRDKEGRPTTYAALLEKADPRMAALVAPEALIERQNKARAAVAHLRNTLVNAKLDTLIVLGDDQDESYLEDCRPAF